MLDIRATAIGKKFFEGYLESIEIENVRRMGVARYGCNGAKPCLEPFFNKKTREHSDMDHSSACQTLLFLMRSLYGNRLRISSPKIYTYMDFILKYHELGETITGDIPADGTRDDEFYDANDRNEFYCFVDKYILDEHDRIAIKHLYDCMDKKSSYEGRLLYLIDKLEAIYRNFAYEYCGRPGNIMINPDKVSEIEKERVGTVGSTLPADVWAYGFLATDPTLEFYECVDIFIELIQSAAMYVRGRELDWIDMFLNNACNTAI